MHCHEFDQVHRHFEAEKRGSEIRVQAAVDESVPIAELGARGFEGDGKGVEGIVAVVEVAAELNDKYFGAGGRLPPAAASTA